MNTYDFSATELSSLGHQVADRGVASANAALGRILRAAAAANVSHFVTDVLLDPREPEVARQRAFGAVLVALQNRIEPMTDVVADEHVAHGLVTV